MGGVRLSAKSRLQQICPHDLSVIFCCERAKAGFAKRARSGPLGSGNLYFVQHQILGEDLIMMILFVGSWGMILFLCLVVKTTVTTIKN